MRLGLVFEDPDRGRGFVRRVPERFVPTQPAVPQQINFVRCDFGGVAAVDRLAAQGIELI